VAQSDVFCVGWASANSLPWVQILDRTLDPVVFLRVRVQITLDEAGQVDKSLTFLRLVGRFPFRALRQLTVTVFLQNRILVLFYQPVESALSDYDNAVALELGPL
jgi:hypothetical protein